MLSECADFDLAGGADDGSAMAFEAAVAPAEDAVNRPQAGACDRGVGDVEVGVHGPIAVDGVGAALPDGLASARKGGARGLGEIAEAVEEGVLGDVARAGVAAAAPELQECRRRR